MNIRIAFLPVLALVLGGCVSAGKYKSAVAESASLQDKVSTYESELAALRSSASAKDKAAAEKIDSLQKQAKDLGEQAAALQKSQTGLEQERKDLKKVNELLKADNERLEKSIAERQAEYGKAVAKLKAVVDDLSVLDDGGKPSR